MVLLGPSPSLMRNVKPKNLQACKHGEFPQVLEASERWQRGRLTGEAELAQEGNHDFSGVASQAPHSHHTAQPWQVSAQHGNLETVISGTGAVGARMLTWVILSTVRLPYFIALTPILGALTSNLS